MILFQRYASNHADALIADEGNQTPAKRIVMASVTRPGSVSLVEVHVDERCAFVQLNGWWLYVATPVGLACYPELATLLANAPTSGRQATLKRLENLGLLAFVAFCEMSDEVSFGRSLDGFGSLFFSDPSASLIVSDSHFAVARRLGTVTLSKHDERVWGSLASLDPEGSFLEGVKRCFAGVMYRFEADPGLNPNRVLMARQGDALGEQESAALLLDGLMTIFSAYGNRLIALRLSGGVDSRVLLAAMMEAVRRGILRRDQIICISVLYPGLDCDETEEIRQLMQIADFEWVGIEANREVVAAAYECSLCLPAPPYPTGFMGTLCAQEAKKRGVEMIISGHGGDEIFDFDLTDLLNTGLIERVRRSALIRKLRASSGLFEDCKTLASICFGRRLMRDMRRMLKAYGLPRESLYTHRLGRRIALARGCGYEMSSCYAAAIGLSVDAPLLRGPFFGHFDPSRWALTSEDAFKAAAFTFMNLCPGDLSEIVTVKATFSSVINAFFPPTLGKCDDLDGKQLRGYAAEGAFADWRRKQEAQGVFET